MDTQGCEAAGRQPQWRIGDSITVVFRSTPFRPESARGTLGKISEIPVSFARTAGKQSPARARTAWAGESIRQKIIGHRMPIGGCRGGGRGLDRGLSFCSANTALTLLDEPAGHHGVGVFVEPLVEKRGDLLAEIGGVAEAGEFVGLQGVTGSGEKKLPRRLSAVSGQDDLQYVVRYLLQKYPNNEYSVITSNAEVHGLWKSVENEEISQRACSGCAGDYEDPDRTDWEEGLDTDEAEEVEDEPRSEK